MSDWWAADPVADGVTIGASGRPRITVTPLPRFADAIGSVESGGDYAATGPVTRTGDRAYGKYQVMGANIPEWTRQVLGREMTPQEFVASPTAQDAVFKAKFGSYVQKYGPEGAAKAWFAGEGGMNDPNRKDILGTTVAGYADKFNRALGYSPENPAGAPVAPQQDSQWWSSDPPAQAPIPDQVGPERPKNPVSESLGRGAAQGLTANFYDELRGLMEAGGLDPKDPASLGALVQGAYKYWTGDPTAVEKYNATAGRERGLTEQAAADHPVASGIGNVAGAVVLPVGGALSAATLPARMARGTAVGAAYGGLAGAGEGVGAIDTAARAATGAVLGGAVGGVAPPIVEGAIQGVSAAARPIITALRGARNPEGEAARRVVTAIQRDIKVDPAAEARLTPAEFVTSAQQGGPAAIVDLGGETTRALARSAANTSPEGRAVLNRSINDRFEEQSGRATDLLTSLVRTPANAGKTRDALEQLANTARRPFYEKAYKDGAAGIVTPELQQLSEAPIMQAAIKEAVASVQNKVSSGRAMSPLSPQGKPTLEFWDQVKRSLDSKINVLQRQGDKEAAADASTIRSTLINVLDREVPSYGQARGVAATLFKANDALDAGEKFVTQNFAAPEVRKALSRMTPEERDLFAEGFVSRLVETINKTGDRRNVLNSIMGSPAAREKITLALGPQRAAQLEAGLRVEGIMDLARGAVQGNSTTARQLAELGFAGGAGSLGAYGAYNSDPSQMAYAAVAGALLAGRRGIDQRVAGKVAEMLTSKDPQVLLKGIRMVAKDNRFMDSLRIADRKIAAAGGQQTPVGVPAIQSMATSRADENSPNVPGPPGQ